MKIATGIVLFNPTITRLRENIDAIYKQTDIVILFDNGSKNVNEIETLIHEFPSLIFLKYNKNLGIATALNKITEYCWKNEYDWLLTLDQDSICPQNLISELSTYIKYPEVAVLCPKIVDKRQTYRYAFQKQTNLEIEEIQECITSGSLVNLEILKKLDGFEDVLFIDYVDYEYCKRAIVNKYKILQINSVILDQELGDLVYSKHKSLYLKLGTLLHSRVIMSLACKKQYSPLRRYYCARNHVYYVRKYKKYCNIYKEMMISVYVFCKMLILGHHKIKLIRAIIKGTKDGLFMKVEPYRPIR